jgi:hypothetical protein
LKPKLIITVAFLILVAAGVLGMRSWRRAGWESSLRGPYPGLPFADVFTNSPASVLLVPSGGQLEVYELVAHTNPVLVLRSETGAVKWSRLLMPEQRLRDETVERASVRGLRLKRLEHHKQGHEVLFTCDWDWGGKESGLIDLDTEYGFKSFSISW